MYLILNYFFDAFVKVNEVVYIYIFNRFIIIKFFFFGSKNIFFIRKKFGDVSYFAYDASPI